jgi:hypothetical protein
MKTQIPDALKADVPQTTWGKVLTATPVIMTVIATMLAGLSSSEMTRAQYARALAAQQQSKAGDQWSFFQAKRLRGSMQRSTLDLLLATTPAKTIDAAALPTKPDAIALAALQNGQLPPQPPAPELTAEIQNALKAVEAGKPEDEIVPVMNQIPEETLAAALKAARDRATSYDETLSPVTRSIEAMEAVLPAENPNLRRDFLAARLRYAAARYEAEARLNQAVAGLLELQVRKSNITAERHHRRSQRFFFGMLAAQAAVIVSTFSLAARQRSFLWLLAAVAGLLAISFAVYVYFYV